MKRVFFSLATLLCAFTMSAQTKVVESPQTDAVYRIPMDNCIEVVATTLTPVSMGLGHSLNLLDFCAWELTSDEATAVVAPRDGVVESVSDGRVLILHEDGIYTRLRGMENVCVGVGAEVQKGDRLGKAIENNGKWSVRMEVFHLKANGAYGTPARNGKYENLVQYINPIFTTRGECKVQLTNGNSYTTKARTWCWPWE